jgi:hypothetical protein
MLVRMFVRNKKDKGNVALWAMEYIHEGVISNS